MNFKKIIKCTDKSFIINTTILHIKRKFVKFDFMPTLKYKAYKYRTIIFTFSVKM